MHLTALHFVGKVAQEKYISKNIPIFYNTSALNVINNITSTLLHNDGSEQQVYLNSNLLTEFSNDVEISKPKNFKNQQ